ncbi:MAG: 50S ribosomal protein L4 [bacterium]|nr:50S ribosomal protein L4 [bacterium]
MGTIAKINLAGEEVGRVEVPAGLEGYTCAKEVMHACVVAHLANARQGTASTLTKGEVDKTGRKPWPQKGTGRARAGYVASPLWRGGGVVFGPKPRDYGKKVNRQMKQAAFFGALAERVREGQVRLIEDWKMEVPKTKVMAGLKKVLGMRRMLCVSDGEARAAYLSARNVPGISFQPVNAIGVYDVLAHTGLVLTEGAWQALLERFGKLGLHAKEARQ